MRFEFASPTHIIFGPGTIREIGPLAVEMGRRAFVVTGQNPKRAEALLKELSKEGIEYVTFGVNGEPTTTIAKTGIEQARKAKSDLVIGIGGGSVLDTGKAIAAMLTNTGELEDYLEVVGQGKPLTKRSVPYIAIPTTAGTGAEVTRNAVLGVPEHQVKVSLRSSLLPAYVALIDPELTYSMSPAITASTGLDALTQLMEAYVSNKANPLTDGICREGLMRAGRSLQKAYEDGSNPTAREDMALASLFSGLALANAKLGAVHGFASPLGGMICAPHGTICARLLPHVIETNVKALQKRTPNSPALTRYGEIAQLIIEIKEKTVEDLIEWVRNICQVLKVPPLSEFGLKESNFQTVVAKAQKSSSMKGNPITLTEEELTEILKKANNR
ncbi:MAG: iron-containing alcohol dehydrogenase [Sedimentisphaerales bacterium]|nr:iron-containing alcohol dehydrogenase [Sedimentisphaerales bacterium]